MKNNAEDWWQLERFVTYTKHLLPPELEILADPPPEHENYNCFLYALGLHTNKTVLQETQGFIYDSLIKHLLTTGDLVKTDTPQNEDYIVYQDLVHYPNNLTHIGIVEDDKVISKWAWGPLVKHSIWDVPAEYGDAIFYIRPISIDRALSLYQQHKDYNVVSL